MSQATAAETLVTQMIAGKAPERLRSAAARGALPLPRVTLVRLYLHLLADAVEEIRISAKQSLDALDHQTTKELLADATCAPEVLNHFAADAARDAGLAEGIVFHPATGLETMAVLASTGNNAVVDLVLTNEERLRRQPALLEQLMNNPSLRGDHRGKILELLERSAKEETRKQEEIAEAADDEEPSAEELEAAKLLNVDVGTLLFESEIIDGEEFAESDEPEIRNAYQKIITLTVGQKAILAMKGGREERLILVRDTNKVVSLGVLKNPRINEGEVEAIAQMRNVSEDVLRVVAQKRDWVKNYQITLALITNPRTPQSVSSNFIPRLTNRDLKGLVSSREVPELIRRMARRTFDTRTKKQASNFKKK